MNATELQALKGRSLPSKRFVAWIVDQVSATEEGRSRLLTANLQREQYVWTRDLIAMFEMLDAETKSLEPPAHGVQVEAPASRPLPINPLP